MKEITNKIIEQNKEIFGENVKIKEIGVLS